MLWGRHAWLQLESQDVCRISVWSNVAYSVSTNFLLLTRMRLASSSGCVQCRPSPRRLPSVISCAKENMTFVVPCSNLLMRRMNSLVRALVALSRLPNLVVSAWLATNMFMKNWHCSPVMVNGILASAILYFYFCFIGKIPSCKIGVRFPRLTTPDCAFPIQVPSAAAMAWSDNNKFFVLYNKATMCLILHYRPVISHFITFKCKYKYNSLAVLLVRVRIPGHACFNYSARVIW